MFYNQKLIPKNWQLSRLKYVLDFSNSTSENYKTEKNLALTKKGITQKDISLNEGQIAKNYEKYTLIKKNQICMNPMDLISGWADISPTDGLISPAYYTLIPKEKIDVKFLNYFLQSNYYRETFFTLGKGVASHDNYGRWVLTPQVLKDVFIYYPTLSDQKKISSFLDRKSSSINSLIEKSKEKIELLKEKKNSIIYQTVTKGLDQKCNMKDSGINWIGKIPSSWIVGKLYQYSIMISGSTPSREKSEYWEGGTIPWMSSGEINKKIIKEIDHKITSLGFENSSTKLLPIGTVMIALNGQGKTKGSVGILEVETTCNQSLCGMIFNNRVEPKYAYYFLDSQYKTLRGLVGEGVREGISVSFLGRFPICIPPIPKQIKIISYLDKQTKLLDKKIDIELKKINLLNEYKQTLISSLINGDENILKDVI